MQDGAQIEDNATTEVTPSFQPERTAYEVVAESGLFKNGQQYNQGDLVELDVRTANNFIANGDIKEVEA